MGGIMLNSVSEQEMQQMIDEIMAYEEVNGEDEFSLLARANLASQIQDYICAKELLLEAYKMNSLNVDVLYSLGTIYEILGDLSKSVLFYALAAKQMQIQEKIEDYEGLIAEFECRSDAEKQLFKTILVQEQGVFVFLAICGFSVFKQRYQNLAIALVELGHEVIYVNPTMETNLKQNIMPPQVMEYTFQHAEIMEGVKVLQPLCINGYDSYEDIVARLTQIYPSASLIVSNVGASKIIERLNVKQKVIFDCADDNSDFKNAFWSSEKLYKYEQKLFEIADIVTTTSITLFLKKYLVEGKEQVYLSKNAVSPEELGVGSDDVIPQDLESIPGPRVGYVGMIYERFDRELFYELAKNNPDISFVIVGGIRDNWVVKKYPNIYILGLKPHNELQYYYRHMDVCIIPYKDDAKMSMSCDPVKIYEHICCNVPTITTYMPDTAIEKPLVYHANTVEGFQDKLNELLQNRPYMEQAELNEYLMANSWLSRAGLLIRIVQDKLFKEDKTEQTLLKLQEQLTSIADMHPNFKVIYGLSHLKDDYNLCKTCVETAYGAQQNDFNTELMECLNKGVVTKHRIDIFNPPLEYGEKEFVEIHWLNTFWCNNTCDYCHMPHDRKIGHAFDVASPSEWSECFAAIKVPFFLNITGGEAFLDIKNFTEFYNLIIDLPNLIKVRIDTNLTLPAKALEKLNVKKTTLMTSYHPSRHTPEETLNQVKSYRKLGFDISMVNMVCKKEQMPTYEALRGQFEEQGIPLAVSVYFGEDAKFDNATLNAYDRIVDKTDIGFKTFFTTEGLPCRASKHFISLNPQGMMYNCWGESKSIFDRSFLISKESRPCPMKTCNCIEKYSMLEVTGRDVKNSLNEYIRKYTNDEKTKIILVVGYFGDGNFGDELLLDTLLKKLRSIKGVMPIVAAFNNEVEVAKKHNVVTVSLQDKYAVAQATALCDAVIVGPGGLIDDSAEVDPVGFFEARGTYSYLYPIMLAQMNGKKTYTLGLGVKEFSKLEAQRTVNMLFNRMDWIGVRDEYSANVLRNSDISDVKSFADMAFTYDGVRYANHQKNKVLGINLRYYMGMDVENIIVCIAKVIQYYIAEGWQIHLIALQEQVDMPVFKVVLEVLSNWKYANSSNLKVIIPKTIEETIKALSEVSILVAMRLHANIMAAYQGIPSIFLGYDEKVEEAARLLKMDDYLLATDNLQYGEVVRLVERMKKEREVKSKELKQQFSVLTQKANAGWKELKERIESL